MALRHKGMSQQAICRTLRMERKTIRRFLRTGQFLTQGFAEIFRSKQEEVLQKWLIDTRKPGLPEIDRFCEGLVRDAAAVTVAVTLPWSNGQVEGQIQRLKL